MAELIVLVVDKPSQMDDVLNVWVAHGVPGVTMLDSAGLGSQLDNVTRDDLPLVPSLESLLRSREESHRMVFSVVPDGFNVDALVKATEQIIGPCEASNTGFMFTVPVSRTWGLRDKHAPENR